MGYSIWGPVWAHSPNPAHFSPAQPKLNPCGAQLGMLSGRAPTHGPANLYVSQICLHPVSPHDLPLLDWWKRARLPTQTDVNTPTPVSGDGAMRPGPTSLQPGHASLPSPAPQSQCSHPCPGQKPTFSAEITIYVPTYKLKEHLPLPNCDDKTPINSKTAVGLARPSQAMFSHGSLSLV